MYGVYMEFNKNNEKKVYWHIGWYNIKGYIKGERSKMVKKMVLLLRILFFGPPCCLGAGYSGFGDYYRQKWKKTNYNRIKADQGKKDRRVHLAKQEILYYRLPFFWCVGWFQNTLVPLYTCIYFFFIFPFPILVILFYLAAILWWII